MCKKKTHFLSLYGDFLIPKAIYQYSTSTVIGFIDTFSPLIVSLSKPTEIVKILVFRTPFALCFSVFF